VPRFAERLERRALFATTVFTINPALSAINLEGEAAGFELKRQDDGSLRARYDGAIVADYVAGTSIRFLGGSEITAETRGRFDPGNAPGNYAGEATQFGATVFEGVIRRLKLDLFSDLLAVTGGNFPSTGEKVRVTSGRFTYDSPVSDDSFDLEGNEVANKTTTASSVVTGPDGVTRLTIPVDVTYEYSSANAELRLTGQIVAEAGPDGGLRPRVDANGTGFGTGNATVFTTGGPAVTVVATGDEGLRVTDFDSTSLTGATARFTAAPPNGTSEVLAVNTAGTPLTATYDAANGILSITGNGTTADYQQVLRTLTYANSAPTPTLGDRTIQVHANDATGAGPAADLTVSVEEPFNPNTVRIGDGENKSATFTDADGTVTTITLAGGTATVRLSGAESHASRKPGVVVVSGTNVQFVRLEASGTGPLSRLVVKTVGGNGAVDLAEAVVDGALRAFGGKGLNATGTVDFNGPVAAATFANLSAATVTGTTIGKFNVGGAIVGSTLTVEDPFNPALPTLGSLAVKGSIAGSRITSNGTVGTVKAAGLVGSEIYAGVVGGERFPSAATAFANEAALKKLTLKAAPGAAAFANSVIAANNLGKINLGVINTDNAATPFGILADTIAGLSATNTSGQRLKLAKLDDPAVLAAVLPTLGFTFGDFQVRLV
jgi:hypothetical protein